ncbi:MAG: bifunctional proline dehydrogenase/L-glutamate gamma-semialdehyde dehydrogenase PutA [Pseudomonadota bacterium]
MSLSACRDALRRAKYMEETQAVAALLQQPAYTPAQARAIEQTATQLVAQARHPRHTKPLLDTFLGEYGLSNSEGIALMCLAESLLRVPDWDTADLLIADKLGSADWAEHAGNADSLLVNASTWALMLTGRIVELDDELTRAPISWLKSLVARVSEPVVQAAVRSAMQILGREFVLGETIESALLRRDQDQAYSFDMLGEAARDTATAERYFDSYLHAIQTVGGARTGQANSISIKLSALHPRYETAQHHRVMAELLPELAALSEAAAALGLTLAIDAEEADRLELSIDLFSALVHKYKVHNVGFVVQAYSKRAPALLDWLIELATAHNCVFNVRLGKGAYWDTEIKHAQQAGLPDFPVYTRKANTDLSYLVCARKILQHPEQLFGQFATHNAHTLAAIVELGRGKRFELQRLHGMGEVLYNTARETLRDFPPVRTYAPVGSHEDLLAYLVRRLLENGANSSFVNRFLDAAITPAELIRDPLEVVANRNMHTHPAIRAPGELFAGRRNSAGVDLADRKTCEQFEQDLATHLQTLTTAEVEAQAGQTDFTTARRITAPYDQTLCLGHVPDTPAAEVPAVIESAQAAHMAWDALGVIERQTRLLQCADALEAARTELVGLLVHEAGKTITDAINEVREAVDFCRYYAQQAEYLMSQETVLPGPTGELNTLQLQGRGVWICISPWNFPLAIFVGQISAALVTGNTVVTKAAEATPLIARRCVQIMHAAGIPQDVCQSITGDGSVGNIAVQHPLVAGVAFTGSTATARHINLTMAAAERGIAPLIAETGGQNAMIVDSTALLEQVTDDVIQSAFLSAGQRCSALRVLYLQEEIADVAITLLIGAMEQLTVGDPSRLATDIGPVISARAAKNLHTHISRLRAQGWLRHQINLTPACQQGFFVAPTLAEIPTIDVLEDEHFGPILHVIRFAADQLQQVVSEINSTGFGLTGGIHTRIDARAAYVAEHINAGNLYVNRNITGAVVGSQPFGGQGRSGTGPKAGGPNYLRRFVHEKVITANTVATGGNTELLNL